MTEHQIRGGGQGLVTLQAFESLTGQRSQVFAAPRGVKRYMVSRRRTHFPYLLKTLPVPELHVRQAHEEVGVGNVPRQHTRHDAACKISANFTLAIYYSTH